MKRKQPIAPWQSLRLKNGQLITGTKPNHGDCSECEAVGKLWQGLCSRCTLKARQSLRLLTEMTIWIDSFDEEDSIDGADAVDFLKEMAETAKNKIGIKTA